jgi:hypothetical protein
MPIILLEFKFLSDATNGYYELKRLLTDHQSIRSINLVPISEHRQVTCQFRKRLTLDESSYPLNVAEAVIEGERRLAVFLTVNRVLIFLKKIRDEGLGNSDLGKAQPLIVAVNCMLPITPQLFTDISLANTAPQRASLEFTLQDATQELVDLIITCPTEHDAAVLRGLQAVDLPSGHSIVIPEISKPFQRFNSNIDLLRYLTSHLIALVYIFDVNFPKFYTFDMYPICNY